MLNKTKAMTFLEEKLSPEDFAEFKNLLGQKGVGVLTIHSCSIGARVKAGKFAHRKPTDRAYTIGIFHDDRSVPTFPPEERILEFAHQHLPAANLEILEIDPTKMSILVRMAGGSKMIDRMRFAQAIANETYFAR